MEAKLHQHGHFIDGKVSVGTDATTAIVNPATGQTIGHVAKGTPQDADAAVAAARKAFEDPEWRFMDPTARGRLLTKLAQLVFQNAKEIAALEVTNQGKPFREALGDVRYAAQTFEYFAGAADKIQGDTIPVPGDRLNYTLRQPLGVTAHIAPWNFPFQLASRSVAPALAAGNTVVLKPASLTPLTALKMAELGLEAGLPPGALNVVTGPGGTLGNHLVAHEGVDGVYLTGSVETGRQVLKELGNNLKPFTLELGGKNPNIVFADADLERAVKGCALGAFMNAGQMCWAGSRVLVNESMHDDFVAALKERVAGLKAGDGMDKETYLGPLVSPGQKKSVSEYVAIGKKEGAKLVAGGGTPDGLKDGNFLEPTVFDEVAPDMRIAQEEIFGPVVSVLTFKDYADAIRIANGVEFGLYAGIWTKDLSTAHRAARDVESGMVTINEYPITFPQTPFAATKQSGLGIEQSMLALDHYTRIKNVNVRL
jgi:acyl-CoA reductase-like NAD-dependent aldehyde dehydrogenase